MTNKADTQELLPERICIHCGKVIIQSANPNDIKWYHREDGCVPCVRTFAMPAPSTSPPSVSPPEEAATILSRALAGEPELTSTSNIWEAASKCIERLKEESELWQDDSQRLREELGDLHARMLRGELVNADASPPAVDSQPAQYLSDDLRKVVAFAATCIILFANEGDYFRCLRCDGESLHGRSAATGNVTHVKGCPVLLANELLFRDDSPVAARPDALKAEIDAAWLAIHHGWDIEPRSYFEAEAPKNGFESPLAMAVHHMWKREVKSSGSYSESEVQQLLAAQVENSNERLRETRDALKESVKLQSHYAKLLNMWDGGERLQFADADEWLARLAALEAARDAQEGGR